MRCRGQFQKRAVFPQDEFFLHGKSIVLLPQWVRGKPRPVGFICRKVLDGINTVRQRRRAFVGCEIADEIRTATRDRLPQFLAYCSKAAFFVGSM